MVLAQLIIRDCFLLFPVSLRANDIIHPPLVAGGCTEHTSHQMIVPVRMGKSMKRIEFIHTKFVGGNKDRTAGAQGDITHTVSHSAGANSSRRIVAAACCHLNILGDTELLRNFRKHRAYRLIAFINLRKLLFLNTADLAHFLRPAAILHIKQQHAGCIRHIRTVYAGEFVRNIILGQHNLLNSCEILRLFIFYPKNLGRRKSRKGNIGRILGKLILTDNIVQIIALLGSSPIIPQNRRTNHLIVLV